MKTLFNSMFRYLAMAFMAIFPLIACTPEEKPDGGQVDPGMTEEQIAYADSLADALYKQARVMQLVLTNDQVLVSSCAPTEQEGVYKVTMSTGASFEAHASDVQDRTILLSYLVEDDVKYWAAALKDAEMTAFKDADGEMVALTTGLDFKVSDKGVDLKVADAEYPLGYTMEDAIQVFRYNLLKDAAGVVYAIEFVFGDELSEVVYVSGYEGVYFYLASDQDKSRISEIYVPSAANATVAVYASEGQQWEAQAAEGWTATVRKEGDVALVDIVPSAEQEPVAASEGDEEEVTGPQLQIVSPEGDFVFASITLVTEPFRTLAVSMTDVIITPSTGVGKFAYGLSLYTDFDEQEILSHASEIIAGTAQPSAGAAVSEVAVVQPFETILGGPLAPESRYVLWAVADGVLLQLEVSDIDVDIQVEEVSLLDADVNVSVSGVNHIFAGLAEVSDEMVQNILYQVNNRISDPVQVGEKFEYKGTASDFPAVNDDKASLLPQTSYAVWVVPVVDGEYEYSEKDIIYTEFTTNSIVGGGSLELTCSEATATTSTLSFDLSCEGAAMIYYAFLKATGEKDGEPVNRYADQNVSDAARFEQIISEDTDYRVGAYGAVVGNQVKAIGTDLNDEAATMYWLFAVAVDEDGKYGKVHCASAKTLALDYDRTISLTVEAVEVAATMARIKVTSQGGDLSDYIYWVGSSMDPFYRNTAYCGNSKSGAQKYMAMHPDDENIAACMRKYGSLAEDGTLLVDGLNMETTYVMMILEKGDVYYSPIGYKLFQTLSVDLGDIVKENTDKWTAAKNSIKIDWHKDTFEQPPHLMAYYSFDFTCPTDMTAFIMCAGKDYYQDAKFTKIEQFMIDIETYASRRMDKDHTVSDENGQYMTEPDYYKNGVHTKGQLMSVNDFYVHGSPLFSAVTYFAAGTHKDGDCAGWDKTTCAYYDRAVEMIAYFNTIEPYRQRAASFGLEGDEAETWAQALLEKYSLYYKNAVPLIYINDGSPLFITNPSATGVNEEGVVVDRVFVMLRDLNGNYYEPMTFEVPNYFEEK
ncbi:MAG: hypothetical protein E7111_05995 [Bacteroidales bacterium]|nr:hypothetical protein [Bacteroidales bacterium]